MCQYNSVIKKPFHFLKSFQRRRVKKKDGKQAANEWRRRWHSQTRLKWGVKIDTESHKNHEAFVVAVCFFFYLFIIWQYSDECFKNPPLTCDWNEKLKKVNLIFWWISFYLFFFCPSTNKWIRSGAKCDDENWMWTESHLEDEINNKKNTKRCKRINWLETWSIIYFQFGASCDVRWDSRRKKKCFIGNFKQSPGFPCIQFCFVLPFSFML